MIEVRCDRREDGDVDWTLLVCGVEHGTGTAVNAGDALIEAAFVLRERALDSRTGSS